MKRFTRAYAAAVAIAFLAIFLVLDGVLFPFEFAICMLVGWIAFLKRILLEAHLNPIGIASGIAALVVFSVGLHAFLRWLNANLALKEAGDLVSPHWRIRWTFQLVAIIVFTFIAGISMVGITHQCAWLATAKEPMVVNVWGPQRFARVRSRGNLYEMGRGLKKYETKNSTMLAGATADAKGHSLHSWQTMLLPYLDEEALFKKIDLSKPWNSPENAANFEIAFERFLNPSVEDSEKDAMGYGLSHYAGNAFVLGGTEPRKRADFQGGEARTIIAGEAAGNFKPWGKPGNWRDPKLGINKSPDGFGGNRNGPTMFLKADGGTIGLMDDIDPVVFQSLCAPGGKEPLPEE